MEVVKNLYLKISVIATLIMVHTHIELITKTVK